jgi:hypothetical protein
MRHDPGIIQRRIPKGVVMAKSKASKKGKKGKKKGK